MANKKFVFTDEAKAALVDRYNSGDGAEKLAKEQGCSVPTMLRVLRDSGAVIRSKGRPKGVKNVPKQAVVAVEPRVAVVPDLVTEQTFTAPNEDGSQDETPDRTIDASTGTTLTWV